MGEPSGIAFEIIIKNMVEKKKILNLPPFILVDDLQKLSQLNELFNLKPKFKAIQCQKRFNVFNDAIPIVDLKADINLNLGVSDKRNNKYVLKSIKVI